MQEFAPRVGEYVIASYKSGEYMAQIIELYPEKATVKVLAVRKHPLQGDLHHPYQAEVMLFHQRKALAYQEKVIVPLRMLQPYDGTVPDYRESLRLALQTEKEELSKRPGAWADRALEELRKLEAEYFPQS
ncbi:kinase-associated lipoprotein B [Brevibacillus humidisoli]|uniref:kinase-associated lipoprotein B n=1 Tax=Brevibacillus humidisoli TaxID=2895522 RepID=UPI001E65BE92|nr:kinase-associated lipoprotein B [Brevibacillus humidisoli]UFJ42695.1 kinase-associated lipoprotein B [Brevibacillus humidisoli]